ncbi:MAG: hypothetical protein E6Q93_08160 [Burkholderiaceae bacterium]|nr:MAG: hypothetical protein E6Q93_08160 [Burkholderiaceae bacterium]
MSPLALTSAGLGATRSVRWWSWGVEASVMAVGRSRGAEAAQHSAIGGCRDGGLGYNPTAFVDPTERRRVATRCPCRTSVAPAGRASTVSSSVRPSCPPMRPDSSDQTVPAPTAEAAAAPARPAIEFKGISHPSLRAVIHDASAEALHASVRQLLEDDPERFEWQPVVIDLVRVGPQAPIDWPGLLSALRVLRLNPVAVAGAAEAFRDEAARLQLGWLAPLPEPRRRVQPIPLPVNAPAAGSAGRGDAARAAVPAIRAAAARPRRGTLRRPPRRPRD